MNITLLHTRVYSGKDGGAPLILGKKNKKITEAKKASRGSEQPPPLPLAQGLATISI